MSLEQNQAIVRLGLGLLRLTVLCVVVAGLSLPAPAAAAALTVTDCSGETGEGRIGTVIGSASAGDTIQFSCSGTIPISSTLTISQDLTLDGSGQSVTLDGGNSVGVLFVNSGVSFTLKALTIAHGGGGIGGGLYNNGGTVTISNSTFAHNSNGENGGALTNNGTVTISNSTFANNSDPHGFGGALANFGTMSISNSTFANNSAAEGGGGLENAGTVSISNSTFANNSAAEGGGLINVGDTMSIGGSILVGNTPADCFISPFSGGVSDQGYNLEGGFSCGLTGTGDLQNTDPKLASALASNGGATQTLALQDGSPAINHIPTSACTLSTDQRGVSRPQGPACDIGAFEFRVPVLSLPSSITVNATSPQGAPVNYTATASEPDDASATPTLSCSPASGSTFAIGTTTVNCTASDAASPADTTTGSFQVVVKGASAQVNDLISLVKSFNIASGLKSSLVRQLQTVLADLQANNTAQACSDLTSFINHVKAQSGKGLTTSQANQLIAAAKQIQAVLGC
jgi:predicted outer membrane repeat protein